MVQIHLVFVWGVVVDESGRENPTAAQVWVIDVRWVESILCLLPFGKMALSFQKITGT